MRALLRRRPSRSDDRGSSAIEAVVAIIVLGTVLLVVLQGIWFMMGMNQAQQAARDGARALSLGRSAHAAVARSLPARADYVVSIPDAETVRVRVTSHGPLFRMDVVREVTMPRTTT